jgi:hypothetical protein
MTGVSAISTSPRASISAQRDGAVSVINSTSVFRFPFQKLQISGAEFE